LIVLLEQKGKPSRLSDLEQALRRSVEKRLALRELVVTLVQVEPDVRSTIADIIALIVPLGPVMQALKEINFRYKDDSKLVRGTIRTQLEAALWLPFSDIQALN
jgi:hypothetical protein